MPKKNKKTPDSLKDAGNKAFMATNYDQAIAYYSEAIDMSPEPSAIYYSNRANAYL